MRKSDGDGLGPVRDNGQRVVADFAGSGPDYLIAMRKIVDLLACRKFVGNFVDNFLTGVGNTIRTFFGNVGDGYRSLVNNF